MKKALRSAAKKVCSSFGGSSSRNSHSSREEQHTHDSEEPSYETREDEQEPEEAQPLKMQDPETGILVTAQEMTRLDNIRNRAFKHTTVFNSELLHCTSMDEEFFDVFAVIGWGGILGFL